MYMIRLLIVGETGVGKTSLLVRFNEGQFYSDQKTTIGVDYKAKEIDIDGETVKLQIWDTAGQERFRSMTSAFYGKAQGVVIVFDVTDRETFNALPTWIHDIRENAPMNCMMMLCVNKFDRPEELRAVSREEYIAFAQDHNLEVVESSAASGHNVTEVFTTLGRQVLSTNRNGLAEVNIDPNEQDKSSIILREFVAKNPKKNRECCIVC
mmetsp:Transcript_12434/g.20827  ORF Transcript_12434/g.20827 Transcript_12434/m.20827 type:complete len:209 (+) Transcript_12434:51-677(+)